MKIEAATRYRIILMPSTCQALDAARQAGTLDDALYRKLSLEYGIEWLE